MKGNKEIAQILKQDYGINNLTPFEDISYEIERYTAELSRVKIQSNSGKVFHCPVYAMFDGHYMSWYGDYGFWGFNCTWKTNITNLAYNSPYYQLEKLESRKRTEFNSERCENEFIRMIKEGDWYNHNLTEKQRKSFDKFITDDFHDYVDCDDYLFEIAEKCENLKALKNATHDETDWYSALGRNNLDESDIYEIFGCEEYELYTIGNKVPGRFFIILYMLSIVAEAEKGGATNE
nr:MAG TPA: hypothetical protein [Caudoviricetes sp.]